MVNNKTRKHISNDSCCDATFYSLNCWYQCKFEELGWMILAKNRGMMDKVMTYRHSIHHLHNSIERKMREIKSPDKKADLKIMLENLMVLEEHLKKDFD